MGTRRKDSVLGNKYGNWVIVEEEIFPNGYGQYVMAKCCCEKGVIKRQRLDTIKSGRSLSCGCSKREENNPKYKHGLNSHCLYSIWCDIKKRCTNRFAQNYKHYGGRGITVCKEWQEDFEIFYDWCLSNGWRKGLEIDRENNDGNYEPSNCRFVTRQINNINQRKRKDNTSGYRGVSFYKKETNWKYNISYDKKRVVGKSFKTAKQAAIVRDIFIIKNDLPHKLNFPELQLWSSL